MNIHILPGLFAVCRLPAQAPSPEWAQSDELLAFTRTRDEFSIVCAEEQIPANVTAERGWRILKVVGPLDFSLVGVLASLAVPLADAGVSIFALSTYDTDYILVKDY
ncbi:MAG: ACT domain-containing protein, partial [Anaerolineales bacterium]|nr:ACT domain-containing protein [Anaerolineales bacterium]